MGRRGIGGKISIVSVVCRVSYGVGGVIDDLKRPVVRISQRGVRTPRQHVSAEASLRPNRLLFPT